MSLKIFTSYEHGDKILYEELDKHLSILKREYAITTWAVKDIEPGTEWKSQIINWLELADIILLLISPDFLASDSCYNMAMKGALEQHEVRAARVIPILLRPVAWQQLPCAHLQCLPHSNVPITQWSSYDEAFHDITKGIRDVINELIRTRVGKQASLLEIGPHPEQTSQVWNVPFRRNPFFTGREEVLTHLHTMLVTERKAAVVQPPAISGLGGIGKTQVAIEYAYRHRHEYQYVLWAQADTSTNLVTTLAEQLHLSVRNEENQNLLMSSIKRWLETHSNWLLIIDNADDLAIIAKIFPQHDYGHILITTRESATGQVAQPIKVEKMSSEEATSLLLRRAKNQRADASSLHISPSERTAALAIANEMDGLPLALDQAGAYIEETGCNLFRYLELFNTYQLDLLKRRGKYQSDHPESVATTFFLAFTRVKEINPIAANLLRFCSLLSSSPIPVRFFEHTPPQSTGQLSAFMGNPLLFEEAISTLRSFSLIDHSGEQNYLQVHRLVQAVLRDQMSKGEMRQWKKSVVQCLATQVQRKNRIAHIIDGYTIMHVFEAVENGYLDLKSKESLTLLIASGNTLVQVGQIQGNLSAYFYYAEERYKLALSIAENILGETHPQLAQVHYLLALLYKKQGNYRAAEQFYGQALKQSEQASGEQSLDTAEIRTSLAGLYKERGEYENARPLYEKVVAVYKAMELADEEETEERVVWQMILNNVGGFYVVQDMGKEAEPFLEKALKMNDKIWGKENMDYALAMLNLAEAKQVQGKYTDALTLYEEALTLQERLMKGQDHPNIALGLANRASLYRKLQRETESEQLYQRALKIYEKTLGSNHPIPTLAMAKLAHLYLDQQRYPEAEPLFHRALTIREAVFGEDHPHVIRVLESLGYLYEQQGKREEAKACYEKGLLRSERIHGLDHDQTLGFLSRLLLLTNEQAEDEKDTLIQRENTLTILEHVLSADHLYVRDELNELGSLYNQQGKYQKAELFSRKALTGFETVKNPDPQAIAACLNNLGNSCLHQKKYEESEQFYKDALKILKNDPNMQESQEIATTFHNLAVFYKDIGKYTDAEVFAHKALEIWETMQEPDPHVMADTLATLGIIYLLQSKQKDAQLFLLASLDVCQKQLGSEHPDTANSFYWLGVVYAVQGKRELAKESLLKAAEMYEKFSGKEHLDTIRVREDYRNYLLYGRIIKRA